MRFRSLSTTVLAAALALEAAAVAAPITYFESASGDLGSSPLTVFTLDTGLNTIDGTIAALPSDWDSFAFTVPAGLEVLQAKVTLQDASGEFESSLWQLRSGTLTGGGGQEVGAIQPNAPGYANAPALPLAAGDYSILHGGMNADTGSTARYTFIFDVHPVVPEPTTLALLALGPIALLRRKRK